MNGIPPPLATDVEDVVWALQTAEALWKRGESDQALVWLRRSVQAAGDAEQDERALDLARAAAEISDAFSSGSQPPSDAPDNEEIISEEIIIEDDDSGVSLAPQEEAPPDARTGGPDTPTALRVVIPEELPTPIRMAAVPEQARDADDATEATTGESEQTVELDGDAMPLLLDLGDGELSSRRPELAEEDADTENNEPFPLVASSAHVPAAMPTTPTLDDPADPIASEPPPHPDLSTIEAFSDLPDDVRDAFGRAANVRRIGPGVSIGGAALALVVEGEVRVFGTADFPTLKAGGVVRFREDPDTTSRIELRAISPTAIVASWGSAEVQTAFSHCPWVDDDLRAAGDHLP